MDWRGDVSRAEATPCRAERNRQRQRANGNHQEFNARRSRRTSLLASARTALTTLVRFTALAPRIFAAAPEMDVIALDMETAIVLLSVDCANLRVRRYGMDKCPCTVHTQPTVYLRFVSAFHQSPRVAVAATCEIFPAHLCPVLVAAIFLMARDKAEACTLRSPHRRTSKERGSAALHLYRASDDL